METRIVELYAANHDINGRDYIKEFVYTNASDEVIKNVCEAIMSDNIIDRGYERILTAIEILKLRGYECTKVDNIPQHALKY